MEWLEGDDLDHQLEQVRSLRASPTVPIRAGLFERGLAADAPGEVDDSAMALSVRDLLTLGRGIAAALSALHEAGIVHRDIKPSNVFLVAGDLAHLKLIDLGIARVDASAVTLTGTLIGTPFYMAPEQARGDRAPTPAVVSALGCVLSPRSSMHHI